MKAKVPYSHFEFISYILQGAVLLTAFDVGFGLIDAVFAYADSSPHNILKLDGSVVFFALAASYLLGQANSTLAHKVLQDGVTKFALGRPSHHLLLGNPHAWIKYFRRLDQVYLDKIFARAEIDGATADGTCRVNDGDIFSRAFHYANASDEFSGRYQNLLSAFNFSRNMACALFLSVPIMFPVIKNHEALFLPIGIITALLTVRYLYLLRAATKEILLHYAVGYEEAPAPPVVNLSEFLGGAALDSAQSATGMSLVQGPAIGGIAVAESPRPEVAEDPRRIRRDTAR